MKFEVLVGSAFGDDNIQYGPGDVLESKLVDLVKRFNSPGSIKFRQVPDNTPVKNANYVPPENIEQKQVDIDTMLNEMSVEDLRKFAKENDIKLAGGVNTKEGITAQIKSAKLAGAV